MMFIIWLPPGGDRKQVQDARFDSHLTGVKKESFHWLTKTIHHITKGFRESKNKLMMMMIPLFKCQNCNSGV